MFVRNFGITLSLLTMEDIELLRYWRNSKEISRFMEYQKFITEEQQKKWFYSLDPLRNFYFLINWNGQKVGLIHTSAINWKDKTAHAGLFVWDKNYISTHVPVLASITMLDCFFEKFGITKYFAKVGKENSVAIKYNAALGFIFSEKSESSNFDYYVLDKNDFKIASIKLKKFASSVSSEKMELQINTEIMNEIEKLIA